jgi:hypothetical protein
MGKLLNRAVPYVASRRKSRGKSCKLYTPTTSRICEDETNYLYCSVLTVSKSAFDGGTEWRD